MVLVVMTVLLLLLSGSRSLSSRGFLVVIMVVVGDVAIRTSCPYDCNCDGNIRVCKGCAYRWACNSPESHNSAP